MFVKKERDIHVCLLYVYTSSVESIQSNTSILQNKILKIKACYGECKDKRLIKLSHQLTFTLNLVSAVCTVIHLQYFVKKIKPFFDTLYI